MAPLSMIVHGYRYPMRQTSSLCLLAFVTACFVVLGAHSPATALPIGSSDFLSGIFSRLFGSSAKNAEAEKEEGEAELAASRGDHAKAIERYTNAINLNGVNKASSAGTYALRAESYRRSGQYQKALQDVDMSLALNPQLALAWREKAETYAVLERYQDALEILSNLLKERPNNLLLIGDRAEVYAAAGNLKAAIDDYTRIIELTDKQGAFYNRGSLYNMSGKYEEALRDFNKALEMNSADAMAYVGRAISYGRLGKYDMARSDFEKAEQLNPSNPYLYRARGFYYERQGLLDLARADYERSASVLTGDRWLTESLRRVGGVK